MYVEGDLPVVLTQSGPGVGCESGFTGPGFRIFENFLVCLVYVSSGQESTSVTYRVPCVTPFRVGES